MTREIQDYPAIIAQAKKDVEDLKQKQRAGSSNIVVYPQETVNTWDYNANVNLTGSRGIFLYFVADTQVAPFVEFNPEIQLNNVPYNTSTDTRLNYIDFGLDAGALDQLAGILTTEQFKKLAYMRITISNPTYPVTINLKIKLRVIATDSGTIGILISN